MARSRFVDPEIKRIPLSEGDYVDIKARLNHGEREDFFATIAPFDADGRTKVNRHLIRTERLLTYIVGWSLTKNGTPVPMAPELPEDQRRSTIRNLETDTFDEIHAALVKHEADTEAEREAAKNPPGAEIGSPAISPSPAPVTGGTSGSAT